MYCAACGTQIGEEARFCPSCGAATSASGQADTSQRWAPKTVLVTAGFLVGALVAGGAVYAVTMLTGDNAGDPTGQQPLRSLETSPDDSSAPTENQAAPTPTPPNSDEPTEAGERTFTDTYNEVASGVLKVHATTCEGTGTGSAFVVDGGSGRRLAATAAHVVSEAASVAVTRDDATYQATVTGVDEFNDLALLEITGMSEGHVFELADSAAAAGDPLAVVGHPLGDPLTLTRGTVSRVDNELWPMFQLDVSISPGNSGGPVIRADGEVAGLLVAEDAQAAGLGYAVHAELLAEVVADRSLLAPPAPPDCRLPLGPDAVETPDIATTDDLHIAIATTFTDYFAGINAGEYSLAFDQLSPRLRSDMSVEEFASGLETSYDFAFEVMSVEETADGARVWLEFISLQAPEYGPDGESCTYWSLDYELIWHDGRLLINRVTGHDDSPGHMPCA